MKIQKLLCIIIIFFFHFLMWFTYFYNSFRFLDIDQRVLLYLQFCCYNSEPKGHWAKCCNTSVTLSKMLQPFRDLWWNNAYNTLRILDKYYSTYWRMSNLIVRKHIIMWQNKSSPLFISIFKSKNGQCPGHSAIECNWLLTKLDIVQKPPYVLKYDLKTFHGTY